VKCFVTGASGFIGANLAHELAAQGHALRLLLRPGADLRGLERIAYERIEGDLLDRAALEQGLRGCDWCFHVAARYALWLPDYRPLFAANVEGTRNVLDAAGRAGCSRIVYTSTVGCIGLPRALAGSLVPSDETAQATRAQMSNPYKQSKWEAEAVARDLAAQGLPIVIVNPSAPVGPRDVKPTPTGQVIVDFLNGRMPAYLDTGLNWVHVRDVARGHVLAAEKGRIGERYILGHADGNWTMKQALDTLAEITGLAAAFAHLDELKSRVTGSPPRAPLAGVRMARYKMFFNPAKAVRELGMPQTPPTQALSDAVEWFERNGYVNAA